MFQFCFYEGICQKAGVIVVVFRYAVLMSTPTRRNGGLRL